MSIKTSVFHQGFTLLGRASAIFAVLLLILYSTSFWFGWYVDDLFFLILTFILITTYCLLRALESRISCKLFSPLFKGKPPVVYTYWLGLEDSAITYGIYRLLWQAIDEVSLSHFGNLVFKSRALSGPAIIDKTKDVNPPIVVLKVPFAVIDLKTQKEFISQLKEKCPGVKLNRRLEVIANKPILRSTNYIHTLTLAAFLLILADVAYSTLTYVELLKHYYLSHKASMEGSHAEAKLQFDTAEYMRTHPLKFSLVTPKLLNTRSAAAGIQESRSKALWGLGEKIEALLAQSQAVKYAPNSFKINLRQARLYAALGKLDEAKKIVEVFTEKHKHALLPRMYIASLLTKLKQPEKAEASLKDYVSFVEDDYFSATPVWPPVGEDAIQELFYQEDLEFLFGKKESSK